MTEPIGVRLEGGRYADRTLVIETEDWPMPDVLYAVDHDISGVILATEENYQTLREQDPNQLAAWKPQRYVKVGESKLPDAKEAEDHFMLRGVTYKAED